MTDPSRPTPAPSTPVVLGRSAQLSPLQRRIWASQWRDLEAPIDNMALVVHLPQLLDAERLDAAFRSVVRSNEVLRTTLAPSSFEAIIAPGAARPTAVVQLRRTEAVTWAQQRIEFPFDLSICGYDSVLLDHLDGTCSWYLGMHHVITDASSHALVIEETAAAYFGNELGTSSYYTGAEFDIAVGSGVPNQQAGLRLGQLYRPWDRSTSEAWQQDTAIPTDLQFLMASRMDSDYRLLTEGLTWTSLLTATVATYLHRLTAADSFSIGLPIHQRVGTDDRRRIGPMVELFPVAVEIAPDDTNRTLHRRISRSIMATVASAVRGERPAADFDAIVNVVPNSALRSFGPLAVSTRWVRSHAIDPGHALRVQLTGFDIGPEELHENSIGSELVPILAIDVNRGAADPEHVDRVPHHILSVLQHQLDKPDAQIGAKAMLAPGEGVLIKDWEVGPKVANAKLPLIVDLAKSLNQRDEVVVTGSGLILTGRELWDWVVAIVHDLRRRGIQPGSRVAISLDPGPHAVASYFAVLAAGCSFVPLDPCHPPARRYRLMQSAAVSYVIANTENLDALRSLPKQSSALIDESIAAINGNDEAYVLFTSGSTGEPKGVPITHKGIANYVQFARDHYFADEGPPVAGLYSSFSFDLTLTTLFAPILEGGRLVTISDGGPSGLMAIAGDESITWLKATPSHLEILHRLLTPTHGLRTLVVGGEAFSRSLALRLEDRLPGVSIFNEYGPTEAVVGCMIHRHDPEGDSGSEVPIGVPASGVTLRIVDRWNQRVPIGAAGELLISHSGVTTGYLGDPEESGPFVELDDQRYYRSGDLVRLAENLTLIYLGRVDEQVKVGGIRLDPIEVEDALARHPQIRRAAVRIWSPVETIPASFCARCGLPDNVPDVTFDAAGVCSTCDDYSKIAPIVATWFKTPDDLVAKRDAARALPETSFDCLFLLSGGKDSTYALHRLVDLGFRPYVLTLDNGFISDGAKQNIDRSVEALGITHEYASTPAMNEIFRDSLERHSNVCHGCYKTIYTLATVRADELGIPYIITGLSRGQLFETRLIPQQFDLDQFDPAAVDQAVLQARKHYHRADDAANRLLDTTLFQADDLFDQIEFVDFYRYVDVELVEVIAYLESETPWERPLDTGRSTNCLVNVAGIHTHLTEQGFHNYAVPYAWDVRLGHKNREDAMLELVDNIDMAEVLPLLEKLGYRPQARTTLTAWLEIVDGKPAPTPLELRTFLSDSLPLHAVPAAFVAVNELPLSTNGKLDTSALPAPKRTHRSATGIHVLPSSEVESQVVQIWEDVLGLEPVSVTDDFFVLGGDSLAALSMIVALRSALKTHVPEETAFLHTTPQDLAAAIELLLAERAATSFDESHTQPERTWGDGDEPPLSAGERAVLFDQQSRPTSKHYNVSRVFVVEGAIEANRFEAALRSVAARHVPLTWSYGVPRRQLSSVESVEVSIGQIIDSSKLDDSIRVVQDPELDIRNGPLLRCRIQPLHDGRTAIVFVIHHVSGDHESFDRLWEQIEDELRGRAPTAMPVDYGSFCDWQEEQQVDEHRTFWLENPSPTPGAQLPPFRSEEADGFLSTVSTLAADELHVLGQTQAVATALAGIAAALHATTGSEEVDVALVASGRTHVDARNLFGYLLNPLPMRIAGVAGSAGHSVVDQAATQLARAIPHRGYPYSSMVADRLALKLPIHQANVLLAYNDEKPAELLGLPVSQFVRFNGFSVADLTFFVEVRQDRVELGLEYSGQSVGKERASALLDVFAVALEGLLRNDDWSPALVERVTETKPAGSIAIGENPTDLRLPLARIKQQILADSSEAAVECDGRVLSYGDLGEQSNVLAHRLRSAGVRAGSNVIIRLPRSIELVVAIVGVQLAGASYTAIDATYPDARIQAIVAASGASVAIVAPNTSIGLATTIALGEGASSETTQPSHNIWDRPLPGPTDIAYRIFTSGSTGTPRGIEVTHQQLAVSNNARDSVYPSLPTRFAMVSSISFDSSIVGVFWSLTTGGTILLPTDAQSKDFDSLVELISGSNASHLLCVPTLYAILLARNTGGGSWPEQVIVAGESCSPSLVNRHFAVWPDSALTNEYGPTEATVWASFHHCQPGETSTPIGRPIPGYWLAVVNRQGTICDEGQVGELVIGGLGVANGYTSSDDSGFDINAAQGIDSAMPEGRYFKTGDRAKMELGAVSFLGRVDNQLNLAGVRIEPEDVEAAILLVPGVRAAIVTVADARGQLENIAGVEPEGPDHRLVAHVEADPGSVDESQLRSAASDALPPLMRPSLYQLHAKLPTTPNGKVDREAAAALALSIPKVEAPDKYTSTSSTDIVERLTAVFRSQLRDPSISATDSFFEAGGHSLILLDVIRQIEREFNVELPTSAIYEAPTPLQLSTLLSDSMPLSGTGSQRIITQIQLAGSQTPLVIVCENDDQVESASQVSELLGSNYPFYALRIESPTNRKESREARADFDIQNLSEAISQAIPAGPVVLGAYEEAAEAALELAGHLFSAGRSVELVLILGSHAPIATSTGRGLLNRKLRSGRNDSKLDIARSHLPPRLRDRFSKSSRSNDSGENIRTTSGRSKLGDYRGPVVVMRTRHSDESLVGRPTWDASTSNAEHVSIPAEIGSISGSAGGIADAIVTAMVLSRHVGLSSIAESSSVGDQCIEALHDHRLPRLLGELLEADESLSAEDRQLLNNLDATTKGISESVKNSVQDIIDELADHGVVAAAAPIADRLAHHGALLFVDQPPNQLVELMDTMGYRRLAALDNESAIDFHEGGEGSVRIRMMRRDSRESSAAMTDEQGSGQKLGGFAGTPVGLIEPLLDFAEAVKDETLLDLGCGDGRVLIHAALKRGLRGIGIESDPALVKLARARVADAGLTDQIKIIEGDAFDAPIDDADIVYAFVPANAAGQMADRLAQTLRPSARLVVHEQAAIPATQPPDKVDVLYSNPNRAPNAWASAGITVGNLWRGP